MEFKCTLILSKKASGSCATGMTRQSFLTKPTVFIVNSPAPT